MPTATPTPTYDPFDEAVPRDPYPVYEARRDVAPLHRSPATGTYVLSRDDVVWARLDIALEEST